MAWCPHCSQDRPIQRQMTQGACQHCGGINVVAAVSVHAEFCRAPASGVVDVCTFCNTAVFARAASAEEFARLEKVEQEGRIQAGKAREEAASAEAQANADAGKMLLAFSFAVILLVILIMKFSR